MKAISREAWCYIRNKFGDSDKYPKNISNVALDINIIKIYMEHCNQSYNSSVYDYIHWLRKLRRLMYPNCEYKVKRRKTPQGWHGFAAITLGQLIWRCNKCL